MVDVADLHEGIPSVLQRWAAVASSLQLLRPARVSAIRAWKRLAAEIRRAELSGLRTSVIGLFARMGKRYAQERYLMLQSSINQSNARLAPIGDPLTLSFGLNRWLASEREEAYSDWLAWILQEVGPTHVERILFGRRRIPLHGQYFVDREKWIPEGHVGHSGRLDCLLSFDNTVIIIEIKITAASNTAKHAGYAKWLSGQKKLNKFAIMIAKNDAGTDEFGFTSLPWQTLTVRLRHAMVNLLQEGRLQLACIIGAFVGAVEQRILGFPSIDSRPLHAKVELSIDPLIKYLASCEEEESDE